MLQVFAAGSRRKGKKVPRETILPREGMVGRCKMCRRTRSGFRRRIALLIRFVAGSERLRSAAPRRLAVNCDWRIHAADCAQEPSQKNHERPPAPNRASTANAGGGGCRSRPDSQGRAESRGRTVSPPLRRSIGSFSLLAGRGGAQRRLQGVIEVGTDAGRRWWPRQAPAGCSPLSGSMRPSACRHPAELPAVPRGARRAWPARHRGDPARCFFTACRPTSP
jgi:hypothetical protein